MIILLLGENPNHDLLSNADLTYSQQRSLCQDQDWYLDVWNVLDHSNNFLHSYQTTHQPSTTMISSLGYVLAATDPGKPDFKNYIVEESR